VLGLWGHVGWLNGQGGLGLALGGGPAVCARRQVCASAPEAEFQDLPAQCPSRGGRRQPS
jgi:hypothetical protein